MTEALWKKFTKEEIIEIINQSRNLSDLIERLGYHSKSSATQKQIRNMVDFYNLKLPNYTRNCTQNESYETKYKICPICGKDFKIDNFAQQTRKYCQECSPPASSPSVINNAMKRKVIELKGGKCERCGYDRCIDALEFHHIDPTTKDMKLANTGACPSFEKYLAETEKCILLCANCHREEHYRLRQENKVEN